MALVAIVGGTGPLGRGLAGRLAAAGEHVVIGSRERARAESAAAALRDAAGLAVTGATNHEAIVRADVVVLAVPAAGLAEFVAAERAALAGKLVIDAVVPLAVRDGLAEHAPPGGAASAGELLAAALPESRVVAAFQTIAARRLARFAEPLEGDVFLCGDDPDARALVAALVVRIAGLRPVDAGPMRNVRWVEGLTALLVNLNRLHRTETSIAVLGLPPR